MKSLQTSESESRRTMGPRIRVLYLTFFEAITHNGIYDSQVKELLKKLGNDYADDVEVSHLAVLPSVVIGKKSVSIDVVTERSGVSAVRQELRNSGVKASFLLDPVVIPKRWRFLVSPLILVLLVLPCLPFLLLKLLHGRYDIIHCRSYVATVCALLMKASLPSLKVICDARGFYPEEGVVHGRWHENSLAFRIWKRMEAWLFRRADAVIALSESFKERVENIAGSARATVIYAGTVAQESAQPAELRQSKRQELCLTDKLVFTYCGSLGVWHDPYLLALVYAILKKEFRNSKLLVITRNEKNQLQSDFKRAGLVEDDYLIVAAHSQEVPGYLAAGDLGIVPLRQNLQPAMGVVADTMVGLKVSEYLAAGLPLLVNEDIHGIQPLMDRYKIGTFFGAPELEQLPDRVRTILEDYDAYHQDCRFVAREYLSLDRSARSYVELYSNLLHKPAQAIHASPSRKSITKEALDRT